MQSTSIEEPNFKSTISNILTVRLQHFFSGLAGLLKAYIIFAVIYCLMYNLPPTIYVLITRMASGIIAIVLIPGAVISSKLVPMNIRSIATSFTLGLVLFLINCQFQLLLILLIKIQSPIIYVVLIVNTLVVVIFTLSVSRGSFPKDFWLSNFGFALDCRITKIFLIAVLIRFTFLLLNPSIFSPDAALFADYARNILEGGFFSNVQNDTSKYALWNGTQYLIHQGFTYVLALSFILIPCEGIGLFAILPLIGGFLIFPVYLITKRIFNQNAAILVSFLIMINPLFIFHSTFGYGPEIVSLLFLVYGLVFLFSADYSRKGTLLLGGLLIGLVDVVWYANFYILCTILPLIVYVYNGRKWSDAAINGILMGLIITSKIFFRNSILFYSSWFILFIIIVSLGQIKSMTKSIERLPLFFGIFIVLIFWRIPLQMVSIGSSTSSTDAPLITAIFAPIDISIIVAFAFFLVFHLSIGIIGLILFLLFKDAMKLESIALVLIGLISSLGTLKVFSLMSGSLEYQYIYSDSRFFLLITLCFIIFIGSYFTRFDLTIFSFPINRKVISTHNDEKRLVLVLGIIGILFLPGFMVYPMGIALIDARNRYGWQNIDNILTSIGNADSIFLVDRAREFTWITGRKSVVLDLSQINLDIINASNSIIKLSDTFKTQYFLVDEYTIAHWRTLDYLMTKSLSMGDSLILDSSAAIQQRFDNVTKPLKTLKYVGQTEPNDFGDFGILYEFSNNSFNHFQDLNCLEVGWSASNGGILTNFSGESILTIGPEASYTNTWRSDEFDLNFVINSGYLVFSFQNAGALISRIEIYNYEGILLSYAERVNSELYFSPIGDAKIGDIRIVIEGNPGDSVIIKSISAWTVIT